MFSRRIFCLVCSVFLFLVLFNVPSSACDTGKAAGLDLIEARIPDKVVAGREFEVVISFLDSSGKLLPEGWDLSTTLSLAISMPGSVLPPVLNSENFRPVFPFMVSIYKAGTLEMALMDREGQVLKRWNLAVVQAPSVGHDVNLQDGIETGEKGTAGNAFSKAVAKGNGAWRRAGYRDGSRTGILDDVTVRETGNMGIVSFSTNGVATYDVSTSTRFSRKWINIFFSKLTPDLPSKLTGGKKIIGEVSFRKQVNGEDVTVSVEILPVRIEYEIFQEGDSLILVVTGQ